MQTVDGSAARVLASYASKLSFRDIPDAVLRRATDCVIDTVAANVYGHAAPAGRIIASVATAGGSQGSCAILGASSEQPGVDAEQAAFANGALSHALELDSLRKPGAGVHPGAVLVPAALAIAQEKGLGGRDLLVAVVAGCEVLFRIGKATRHTAESRGFHAPGLTGPFGSAVAAGRLLRLDADQMTNAIGIAGSLGGGLLEFAASGSGGMVKRLHLGRGAAAGVLAARLAQGGLTGPATVLEGEHGFLKAYCQDHDIPALTAGLGTRFETLSICFKAYACHITAHTPVHAARMMQAAHGFSGADVQGVTVDGTRKMADLHGDRNPADAVAAQYSIAFCVAAALLRDPDDPDSFTGTVGDPDIMDLCRRVEVTPGGGFASSWATRTTIRLRDGRAFTVELENVPGFPDQPFDAARRRNKFLALTTSLGEDAPLLLDRLEHLADEPHLAWLRAAVPTRNTAYMRTSILTQTSD